MRVTLLALLLTLTGCATMREAAGKYSAFAERGIELKGGNETPPSAEAPALPGGLAGDGKAHAYSEPTPRSS